jgi:hypothetical protein
LFPIRPAKIVLEEGPALADDVKVALPANAADEARLDRMVVEQLVEDKHDRSQDGDGDEHHKQHRPVPGKHLARCGGVEQPDHRTDEDKEHGIGEGTEGHRDHAHGQRGTELSHEIDHELAGSRRRTWIVGKRDGRVVLVEPVNNGVEHCGRSWRMGADDHVSAADR